MKEVISLIQIVTWVLCVVFALLIAFCQLFPSMRGVKWTGDEWQVAIILALVAIAVRPTQV